MGRVLALVGPTAVGKTEVAVLVARAIGGEIVSADSMAVYRGADIGTAKPTLEQLRGVPCHMVDLVEPSDSFNVSEYRRLALSALESIAARGRTPVVVGGTGLYVRALLDGMGLAGVPADPEIRSELNERAAQHGSPALHADLAKVDPETAARLHPNDAVRIVRALEVFRLTGLTLSAWIERDRTTRAPIPALRVGLTMRRPELDRRIDARVDAMMSAGLRDEVAVLLARGAQPGRGVMRGLGYSEMCDHLSGTLALDEAVSTIKSNTRRFARRQLTWFRPDRSIHWLDVTGMVASEVADRICDQAGRVDAPLSAERGSSTEHG